MPSFLWPILGGLSGLLAGSFLATLVLRLPRGEGLGGRSHCDGCGAQLSAAELVPLLAFAMSGGRCRRCGSAIDPVQPLIELSAAMIGALALVAMPGPWGFAGALLGWFLLALMALDIAHFWLPDALTLPLIGLGLLLGPGTWQQRLLGMAIGGGGLLAVALVYRWLRKRDGLGLGDVKLMAALGAWLSPLLLPPLLFLAALIGLLLAGLAALRGRPLAAGARLPFGACLCAAGYALWLFQAATDAGLG